MSRPSDAQATQRQTILELTEGTGAPMLILARAASTRTLTVLRFRRVKHGGFFRSSQRGVGRVSCFELSSGLAASIGGFDAAHACDHAV